MVGDITPNKIHQNQRLLNLDVALPIERVEDFLQRAEAGRQRIDPEARLSIILHLDGGDVH